jgi:hypothetical protein
MTVVALITWFCAVALGLLLLVIWLIEYDRDFQRAAATRLPVPVVFTHALLAVTGLAIWAVYLVADEDRLAWTSVVILGVVILLGLIMAARWIPVRRAVVAARAAERTGTAGLDSEEFALPPERNFPLPVVVSHGIFALITVTLVVVTTLRG